MPGPDILFVITQSITRGKKAGIIFACGLCTGLIAHTAAVSLGLSLILYNSPVAFSVLKYMGAAYLIYLGVKSYIHRKENSLALPSAAGVEYKLYRKGILMNILNPKVLLFFICIFSPVCKSCHGEPGRRVTDTGIAFYGAGHCYILVGSLAGRPVVTSVDAKCSIFVDHAYHRIVGLFCHRNQSDFRDCLIRIFLTEVFEVYRSRCDGLSWFRIHLQS